MGFKDFNKLKQAKSDVKTQNCKVILLMKEYLDKEQNDENKGTLEYAIMLLNEINKKL